MSLLDFNYQGLAKVISGGQTGSDQAGLYVAKDFLIETGGSISNGFRTSAGNQPELSIFNLTEHSSPAYPPRTKDNAFNGDATVRLASNFSTAGEVLTLRYVQAAKKPHFDVLLDGKDYETKAEKLVEFLINHTVQCLNVAGNSDKSIPFGYHFKHASHVLTIAFTLLKQQNLLITHGHN